MFEQSTLTSGPPSKRLWATCVGITGEALLVAGAIVAPMVWPQVLPRTSLVTTLLPSPPRPLGKPPEERPRPITEHVQPGFLIRDAKLYEPPRIPTHTTQIIDALPDMPTSIGVPGGIDAGTPGGYSDGVIGGILREGNPPMPPRPVETKPTPVTAPPAEIKRFKVGGVVKMAQVLHRVEPQYPQLAKQMRTEGVVELVGVIATDGHLKELRVVSGHPLLARAALEAVSQWIYSPTQLNGELVEVIAPITVTFKFH